MLKLGMTSNKIPFKIIRLHCALCAIKYHLQQISLVCYRAQPKKTLKRLSDFLQIRIIGYIHVNGFSLLAKVTFKQKMS